MEIENSRKIQIMLVDVQIFLIENNTDLSFKKLIEYIESLKFKYDLSHITESVIKEKLFELYANIDNESITIYQTIKNNLK